MKNHNFSASGNSITSALRSLIAIELELPQIIILNMCTIQAKEFLENGLFSDFLIQISDENQESNEIIKEYRFVTKLLFDTHFR